MSEKIDHRRDTIPMKHETPLATFIREWCRQTGTTQAKLSEMVGIDRSMVSRMTLGTRMPNRDVAIRLADAMGLTRGEMALLTFDIDPQAYVNQISKQVAYNVLEGIANGVKETWGE